MGLKLCFNNSSLFPLRIGLSFLGKSSGLPTSFKPTEAVCPALMHLKRRYTSETPRSLSIACMNVTGFPTLNLNGYAVSGKVH